MKKIKGKTDLPPAAGRQTKPAAPPAGARVRADTAYLAISREGAPTKTDKIPAQATGQGRRAERVKPPMEPIVATPPRKGAAIVEYGDQRPKRAAGNEASARPEQYVRLRVRVRDGQLSVIDSHLVDGPLRQPTVFSGANAYELTLDDRLLHAGDLPDLGVQRSFVNPDRKAPREQRGHHFTERSVFEFMARVPAEALTPDTIGRITLRLHRVKEEARTDRPPDQPLARQFERAIRPLAELVGLPESVLPDAVEKRGARTPAL